jgi:SagB-type dehydrogenase family enzyme
MKRTIHIVRRAASIAAFGLALILLTGMPGKVRELSLAEARAADVSEVRNPDLISLPSHGNTGTFTVENAIARRRSVRSFSHEPVLLSQLSQLLWSAQGITGENGVKRAAPSAGATYPLEIFVVAGNVEGLAPGVYHYLPSKNALEIMKRGDLRAELGDAALSQKSIGEAPLDIVIAAVYERTTGKYDERGNRYVHIEVGAVAENVYLQAEALGLGTTFMGAFSDEDVKSFLGTDAEPLGIMPVGVPKT